MKLEWLKKVSAALKTMNYKSWYIKTTLSSASDVSVRCWVFRDPSSTSGLRQWVNRRCGSCPGSILSTRRIPAAVAAGCSLTWPDKRYRSAAKECETSSATWVSGRSTNSHAQRWLAIPPSGFPAWWISSRSRRWIKCGPPTSPTPTAEGILLPGGDHRSPFQTCSQLEVVE
jgi:hypothetical protein